MNDHWDVVSSFSRIFVAERVPDELDDFELNFEQFKTDPEAFLEGNSTTGGLGGGVVSDPIVTVVVVAITNAVVSFVIRVVRNQVAPPAEEFIGKVVKLKLAQWYQSIERSSSDQEDAAANLGELQKQAEEIAVKYGIREENSKEFASSVIQLMAKPEPANIET